MWGVGVGQIRMLGHEPPKPRKHTVQSESWGSRLKPGIVTDSPSVGDSLAHLQLSVFVLQSRPNTSGTEV